MKNASGRLLIGDKIRNGSGTYVVVSFGASRFGSADRRVTLEHVETLERRVELVRGLLTLGWSRVVEVSK